MTAGPPQAPSERRDTLLEQQLKLFLPVFAPKGEAFVTELKTILAASDRKLAAYKLKKEPEIAAWPGRKRWK